jgi:DNA-binding NarL/FixJ family response regulator
LSTGRELDEALKEARVRAEERQAQREMSIRRLVRMGLSIRDIANSIGLGIDATRKAVARVKAEE